ncbi:hypothetical protein M407DRAFT_140830 [Tulasnella calospora MUT 4182]|uniref:F5/8 type C domain-containing protein n=1 Tax=Tulasnella calospora MUT 4182 TaxID=1051891 RepID=A0A0C3PY21_9AGAM|nr:hypothetical protein M407DRAFT_140830 [Tulasnella calospora MUT 4182]
MAGSLIDPNTKIKVSSTLDRSVGKRYLTDRSPETCWTSSQGLPQTIQMAFGQPVIPTTLSITFQGGFVGTKCSVYSQSKDSAVSEWILLRQVFPEDVNRVQSFQLRESIEENESAALAVLQLKLVFEESSDFFGRITIYDLDIIGMK